MIDRECQLPFPPLQKGGEGGFIGGGESATSAKSPFRPPFAKGETRLSLKENRHVCRT